MRSHLQPKYLIIIFCILNLLIYIDRGAISSNGVNAEGLQKDYNLSLVQTGFLSTSFMVGMLISSPIFAEASKHTPGFRLIAIGFTLWSLATAGCGLSFGFVSLLLCRMAVGIGESSFVALAAPFIDDAAPQARRALWLALFYLCIPVGYAIGVVYGSLSSEALHWRATFILESIASWPFIAFFFSAKMPERSFSGGGTPTTTTTTISSAQQRSSHTHHSHTLPSSLSPVSSVLLERTRELLKDVTTLCCIPVFVLLVLAATCFTSVIGSLAYYGPQAGKEVFQIGPETADTSFGAITILAGTFGTLSGGLLLDRYGKTLGRGSLLCSMGLFGGFLLMFIAFFSVSSFPLFCVVFACGEFFLFITQAPSNALIMWCVPSELRPLAISLTVVIIHVFGDVPMAPVLGAIQSRLQNWRATMCLLMVELLVGTVLYVVASKMTRNAVDFRTVQREGGDEAAAAALAVGENDVGDDNNGVISYNNNGNSTGNGLSNGDTMMEHQFDDQPLLLPRS